MWHAGEPKGRATDPSHMALGGGVPHQCPPPPLDPPWGGGGSVGPRTPTTPPPQGASGQQ